MSVPLIVFTVCLVVALCVWFVLAVICCRREGSLFPCVAWVWVLLAAAIIWCVIWNNTQSVHADNPKVEPEQNNLE
jgi:hypothetical protein